MSLRRRVRGFGVREGKGLTKFMGDSSEAPEGSGRQRSSPVDALFQVACIAGVLVSVGLLSYTHYRAGSQLDSNLPSLGYLKYYVGSALSCLLWVGMLLVRSEVRIRVTLIFVSVAASSYMSEAMLFVGPIREMLLPQPLRITNRDRSAVAASKGKQFDLRTHDEVIEDLGRTGVDAVPAIFPQAFIRQHGRYAGTQDLLPLAGLPREVTVHCNEGGNLLGLPE
jgi:hypothetical protein